IFAVTVAALYLPYLTVGTKVLGFLPTYVQEEELTHGTGFRYLMALERWHGALPAWSAAAYAAVAGLILLAMALAVGFRRDRSDEASVRYAAVLMTAFLVLLTPHYPWYYIALLPFVAIYPKSATLWLLTAGGLHTYQAITGDILPDFYLRQIVFHSLVLIAVAFDVWLWRAGRASGPPPIQPSAATPESLVPVSQTAGNSA
ncbi:MAG: hypothetical protein ACKVP3_07590, partial [Hyphomicrobiaceae bacterium]